MSSAFETTGAGTEISSTTRDPSSYRPTTEGWEEYKSLLPRVLDHLALKAKLPSPDVKAFLAALPWPERSGPMRGAFKIDDQYYYIPCKFRLVHNEPIYYETKQHWVAEVRSEHPGLPGRSTSTLKLRLGKVSQTYDVLLPFISKPLLITEINTTHFATLGRDPGYLVHEFLPHIQEIHERFRFLQPLMTNLRKNAEAREQAEELVPFETDRDSIRVRCGALLLARLSISRLFPAYEWSSCLPVLIFSRRCGMYA